MTTKIDVEKYLELSYDEKKQWMSEATGASHKDVLDAPISEAAEGKATLHNAPEAFVALLKHRRTPMFKIRNFFEGFLG